MHQVGAAIHLVCVHFAELAVWRLLRYAWIAPWVIFNPNRAKLCAIVVAQDWLNLPTARARVLPVAPEPTHLASGILHVPRVLRAGLARILRTLLARPVHQVL